MVVEAHTADSHGVWSPFIFRLELERAMDSALQRSKAARTRSEKRARRAASRASAPTATAELHRLPASPSIQLDGWYSDASKATGEEQDVAPDEADPELRQAAQFLADGWSERGIEKATACTIEEADAVPFRTHAAIQSDEETVAYLHRDDAPAPRGWGMTGQELRRAWLMNRRLSYAQALREAIAKHRGRLAPEQITDFPALRSEAQFAWSVVHRWRFVDELARHGVHAPEKELVTKLKTCLGRTFEDALTQLVRRRKLAETGKLDRFTHELNAVVQMDG
jgi:hypothetical protein